MDYSKIIPQYKAMISNLGYSIFYDGCKSDNSEVFLVLYIPNNDNPNEFGLAFYHIYTAAPLSLDGYIKSVVNGTPESTDEFAKSISNRVKGCIASKSDVVYRLLQTRQYSIDDIYGGGKLHLTPTMLKEVSDWVNFNGGRNPLTREQVRQRMGAK